MTNDYVKIKTWGETMPFQQRNQNDNNKGENTTVDNCCGCQTQCFPQEKKKKDFKEFTLPPAGAEIGGKTFGGYKEMFFNEALLTEAREVRRINGSLTRSCCDDGLLDRVLQRSTNFPLVGTKNEFHRKVKSARLRLSPCFHWHHVCFYRTFSGEAARVKIGCNTQNQLIAPRTIFGP